MKNSCIIADINEQTNTQNDEKFSNQQNRSKILRGGRGESNKNILNLK